MSDEGGQEENTHLKCVLDGQFTLWRLSRDLNFGRRGVELNFISSVRHLAFF